MRKRFLTAIIACVALAIVLAACKAEDNAPGAPASQSSAANNIAPPAPPADGARRITVAELQKELEKGEAVIYDTRAKGAYDQEHIKGALSMPSTDVSSRVGELPKDKLIVFYCT